MHVALKTYQEPYIETLYFWVVVILLIRNVGLDVNFRRFGEAIPFYILIGKKPLSYLDYFHYILPRSDTPQQENKGPV